MTTRRKGMIEPEPPPPPSEQFDEWLVAHRRGKGSFPEFLWMMRDADPLFALWMLFAWLLGPESAEVTKRVCERERAKS